MSHFAWVLVGHTNIEAASASALHNSDEDSIFAPPLLRIKNSYLSLPCASKNMQFRANDVSPFGTQLEGFTSHIINATERPVCQRLTFGERSTLVKRIYA